MRLSKKLAALAIVGGVALSATGAYAWWSTTGSGSATASTGTHAAVSVTQLGSISGLVPGGDAQPLNFKITNSRTTPQYVTSVSVAYDLDSDGSGPDTGMVWNTGCSAADFTLVQPTAINQDLPNGDTPFSPSGASLKLENSGSNQDGCKNQNLVFAFSIATAS